MNNDLEIALSKVDWKRYANKSDYRLRVLAELVALKLERKRRRKELLKQKLLEIRDAMSRNGRQRYLELWESVLLEGWPAVKKTLQSDDENSLELLHSFPFGGEVTEDERLSVLLHSHGRPQSELRELKKRLSEAKKRIVSNVV